MLKVVVDVSTDEGIRIFAGTDLQIVANDTDMVAPDGKYDITSEIIGALYHVLEEDPTPIDFKSIYTDKVLRIMLVDKEGNEIDEAQ